MTREKQIVAIKKLLPKCDDRWLGMAFDYIDEERRQREYEKSVASKEARKAVDAFIRVLRRAEVAYNNLGPDIRASVEVFERLDQRSAPNFHALVATCERLYKKRDRPTQVDMAKLSAVSWAHDAVSRFEGQVKHSRRSKWHRVASILYGEKDADLNHHCAAWHRCLIDGQK